MADREKYVSAEDIMKIMSSCPNQVDFIFRLLAEAKKKITLKDWENIVLVEISKKNEMIKSENEKYNEKEPLIKLSVYRTDMDTLCLYDDSEQAVAA